MSFKGFHHIGLACTDAEKSLKFYTALGGAETFRFPMGGSGKTIYLVDMGGHAVVELIPNLEPSAPAESAPRWVHICLTADDCKAAHDLALSLGAKERTPPQDVNLGTLAVRNSFVYGPDDEVIEFFQLL